MAKDTTDLISRRKLLLKLGLTTGIAYVAPTLAGFDVARASSASGRRSFGSRRYSGPSRPSGYKRGKRADAWRDRNNRGRSPLDDARRRWNRNLEQWIIR